MDALQGAGHGNDLFRISPDGLCPCQAQDGADPFPPGKDAVAHGLGEGPGGMVGLGEEAVEGRIDQDSSSLKIGVEGCLRHHDRCLP